MKVKCERFASATKSWDAMCEDVSAFASELGRERLINISVTEAGGMDVGGSGARGTIFVWYWE